MRWKGWAHLVSILLFLLGTMDSRPHPALPLHPNWVGVFLIVIAGIFLAAAAVGLVVRFNAPQEVPPLHSHDEPPGSSHHHGPGGLVNPED